MTAGKLLHTLNNSKGAIHSLTFNPSEFVLGSCSVDGSVRVFDLQTFEEISTYSESYSEKVLFSPDGQDLLACCQDSLQVIVLIILDIGLGTFNVENRNTSSMESS